MVDTSSLTGIDAASNPVATDPFAPRDPLTETNAQYMARVTAAYKDVPQPTLTPEQAAAGATVEFVRTGAAGVGEYKIVYPLGVGFDKTTGQPTGVNTLKGASAGANMMGASSSLSVAPTETYTAPDGKIFTDLASYNAYIAQTKADEKKAAGQSAYDLLFQEFNQYGLGSLIEPLKKFIVDGLSPAEFTIRLRETDAYKVRFAANADRIKNGLAAIDEATYLGLEDQYQNLMRNYGLPASYYTKDSMGTQAGFQSFIANDVSATELEDRIITAQSRVINSNPEVLAALKKFYPDITNGDILAYTLDPTKALTDIKRKVTAAEIGGAAIQAGLDITGTRAAELGSAGITKIKAQEGFQTVAEVAPRGGQLAAFYNETPYTQATAEQEVFGLAGSVEAAKQRKKLVGLERASFAGQSGIAQGAISRDRSGAY